MSEKLFEIKKEKKRQKPDFIAQDAHKKDKIKKRWRKPRGSDSKMKKKLKGYRRIVKQGYMTPKAVRGFDLMTKLKPVVVSNVKELDNIELKTEGVIISKTVGKLKKSTIINACIDKKITIINLKDPQAYLNKFESELKEKKKKKEEKVKEKQKKEAENKKKAKDNKKKEEKENLSDLVDEKEKKDAEKKEKDKVLISTE
ncbi:MAG: eL32 family ribosomal protein [Minisyncoccales bacterium]